MSNNHAITPKSYDRVWQTLHWLTAIVVLVAFYFGPGGSERRVYSPAKDFERTLHETLGLCVFALVAVRLAWRAFHRKPQDSPAPRWMALAGTATHVALYLLLFGLPLTAITGAWLTGHPLTLLGGVEIAPWFGPARAPGELIAEIHTWLGDAILWLAGLHALAALFHHFVLKDRVLLSMLPSKRPAG